MVDSPYCNFCHNAIETIKHVLWDCPRSGRVWDHVNAQTREFFGADYVTYESVVLGNAQPNLAMETMITWITKLILAINREEHISFSQIEAKFKILFYYEKQAFGLRSKKMSTRWGPLLRKYAFIENS